MELKPYFGFSMTKPDKDVLTAELKISYLRASWGKELIAKGYVIKPGRNVHFAECEIYCKES